jgi:Cu-processing system permease protein
VGYLPENVSFQAGMTGRELLRFYAGLKRAEAAQCDELLGQVQLAEAAERRLRTYSKGMRQRLGLAQALLGRPRLLLLDEPTNGLDPPLRRQFYDVVQALTRKGATALVSSHVLTEIEARADLIAILRDGELAAFGPLADLREASRLPFRLRLKVRPDTIGRRRRFRLRQPGQDGDRPAAGQAQRRGAGHRHPAAGPGRGLRPLCRRREASMRTLALLAGKEFRDGIRNRWVAASIAALAGLALVLALLGSAPVGDVGASALSVTVVSLSSLTVYLLPLIALMLSYDAIVGEQERGTLQLLLSYPVARWQVVLGKFFGHLLILVLAIVLGFGSAALAIMALGGSDREGWLAFASLCGSAALLGAVFIALGYLLSSLCEERAKAAGLAIGLWLLLVVLYDLGLLGLLLMDKQQVMAEAVFAAAMLVNPTDAFRVFNMSLFESVRQAGGLAELGAAALPNRFLPLLTLAVWALAPLALTTAVFARKEI